MSIAITKEAKGSIKATGWIHDQLKLAANGLAGHEYEFYRYVHRSTWLGGEYEYSELHESAPYWFNYIVPLAYTLDDERLKQQAKAFLDYTLDHQAEDGWLGPETTRATRGLWARSLLLFGLTQYAEAEPTETERIVDAIHKFVDLAHSMLKANFTGLIQQSGDDFDPYGFGLSRTHELPVSLQWLYERYPCNKTEIIWETMELMFEGGRKGNRDWTTFFTPEAFPKLGTPYIKTSGFTHGVNLAQGLRYPTVLYRMTGNDSLKTQTYDAIDWTYQYHSSRSGSLIADEHLGGLSPQRGSELCMAVEMMFSMSFLYRFYGETSFADKVERAGFNALPAALSPDWWAHQYATQTNQQFSGNLSVKPFYNIVSYGNTFGLEPNFPCCTVNHPQGYPKYVAASYVSDQKPLPDDQVHSHTHDWVLPATSQWKYAIDPSTLEAQSSEIGDVDLKNPIWASDGPPTTISVDAYPIEWNDDGGQPSDPPVKANVTGTARKVKLVPYGAAKLHIAEFPIVNSTQLR
ncbi:hypothetical protein UCRPC4_g06879 [Phaeomoniella chlamydospora]|uniref:Non-reducing end beta-L-arabinofuranosidase-like GH127 catalytic domain-containing protein n=1 Tax=Phaeomoniella chlamydospora TaxID=158046 RepID=A0A0G2FQ04_PHACM|nr:hypothetical protein UCRPC4_g06879 [Phaeomoniella chlamydospora]